ncbi:MAG TPA: hypothetical protein VGN90_06230 [Pyrinomonadaceae bacterium]|jgi:hypothetical protein|nr:hypothetical protein [Pyrinomonadaceae bacterium]
MKVSRKLFVITATLTLLASLAVPNLAAPPEFTSLQATARGQGTLNVGREVFKVHAVVVKLREDGTGELTLITDLQLFVTCSWSAPADLSKGIDLTIRGETTSTGATGTGKLMLSPDGTSIVSLSLQGSSNIGKRKVILNFVAK